VPGAGRPDLLTAWLDLLTARGRGVGTPAAAPDTWAPGSVSKIGPWPPVAQHGSDTYNEQSCAGSASDTRTAPRRCNYCKPLDLLEDVLPVWLLTMKAIFIWLNLLRCLIWLSNQVGGLMFG